MQLKYSFKKEKMHFFRTWRFLAIMLIVFGFAVGNPLMFKFCDVVLNSVYDSDFTTGNDSGTDIPDNSRPTSVPDNIFGSMAASFADNGQSSDIDSAMNGILGGIGMEDILSVYSDAGMMFATTISTFTGGALLGIMLLLMSAAGGEQKKRAMIVPLSSGLEYKNYLLPKFCIYPLTNMAIVFVATIVSGLLCNIMFENNKISFGMILLHALLVAIYVGFMVSVFLAAGLCSSKPGVMAPVLYVSQTLLQSLLTGFGLRDYHPFALLNYTSGTMVSEGFVLGDHVAGIIVSCVIAIVLAVLMYFITLVTLRSKKTNNRKENEPEF